MQQTEPYSLIGKQLSALLEGSNHWLTNSSQMSAFIFQQIKELNWVGFYWLNPSKERLELGSFQGNPACNPIPLGKGVCGTCAITQETQRIDDVTCLDNHIACDPNSRSELVLPVIQNNVFYGVLDIDSPKPKRFNADDQAGIALLLEQFCQKTDLTPISALF
ncbi:GAF domain-containing protein [Piscirickettsia litoralis]|uniref:Histidine kinase n=1 Tax=Piscirickettsia litoralis TaxID=1891921 RepID=A0ABX3A0L0_9GAMM|nr:GAF domain-containing protein [Piscirickettsia litoralis]ODN42159.1 histidine kinase [Piscirickettsia litoralis]